MNMNPYLNFNGNCQQALDFYVKTLGGKIVFSMTYDQAPKGEMSGDPNCAIDGKKIMHARLALPDGGIIMASDCPPGRFQPMAGCTLNLGLTDVAEADRLYQALSDKGEIFMAMEETFWAKRFAMFKDQFGVAWMINVEKQP